VSAQHLLAPLIGVVAVGVGAQWLAWRVKWPAIVLLALIGLIVGPIAQVLSEVPALSGWFASQNFLPFRPEETLGPLFEPVVSLSVAIILFEGGLTLSLSEFRLAAGGVRRLVWLGAPLAWLFCSAAVVTSAGWAGRSPWCLARFWW
jgi:NhaP-type Na+/H+ or K+/H+ antiporter